MSIDREGNCEQCGEFAGTDQSVDECPYCAEGDRVIGECVITHVGLIGLAQDDDEPRQRVVLEFPSAAPKMTVGDVWNAVPMLLIRAATTPDTERREYETAIRGPIRKHLKAKGPAGRIRCIVLMWGVPVRVLGPPLPAGHAGALEVYKTARQRYAARLSVKCTLPESSMYL